MDCPGLSKPDFAGKTVEDCRRNVSRVDGLNIFRDSMGLGDIQGVVMNPLNHEPQSPHDLDSIPFTGAAQWFVMGQTSSACQASSF